MYLPVSVDTVLKAERCTNIYDTKWQAYSVTLNVIHVLNSNTVVLKKNETAKNLFIKC